jgi:hypothetical protein
MLNELRRLLEKHVALTEADLRNAANALLTQQFLYLENDRQLPHYRLVTQHIEYYRDLFDALGWKLLVDNDFGYVGILPSDEESYQPLSLEETLLLFIAAQMFEEGVEARQTRNGRVYISSEDMLARYESLTRRDRPKITDFRDTLKLLQRHGLVFKEDDDPVTKLPRLALLPALRQIAGERIMTRLESYLSKARHDESEVIAEDARYDESAAPNNEDTK